VISRLSRSGIAKGLVRWKRGASFPPDRWPATEVTERDRLPAIRAEGRNPDTPDGPPQEVYDYQTGKLVGHVGPRGRFVPLEVDPAAQDSAPHL